MGTQLLGRLERLLSLQQWMCERLFNLSTPRNSTKRRLRLFYCDFLHVEKKWFEEESWRRVICWGRIFVVEVVCSEVQESADIVIVLLGKSPLALGHKPCGTLKMCPWQGDHLSSCVITSVGVNDGQMSGLLCWGIFGRGGSCEQGDDFIRSATWRAACM